MSDLFTPEQKASTLKKRFIGRRIKLDDLLNMPVEIVDFEIGKSDRSGHELLYMQLKVYGVARMCWTEGCLLISTLKSANRANLPFRTLILKDKKGYLKFCKQD